MKKLIYLIAALTLLISSQSFGQATITNTVTFAADMTQLIADGFDPAEDIIQVEGLVWDAFTTTVEGDPVLTLDAGNIYKTTLIITTDAAEGDSLRWKFRAIDPEGTKFVNGGWEGGFGDYDGYPLHLQADGSTFELDPLVPGIEVNVLGISNTLNFTADLSGIIGSGSGYFDPETDNIDVMGLDWDGLGTVTDGDRTMVEDEFVPGLFRTSLTVAAPAEFAEGDSTKWKFKAGPGDKFANDGWELGADRWYHYVADGSIVDLPTIVPNIFPLDPPIEAPLQVRFKVDMGQNPLNAFDESPIPVDMLEFVGIKGADSALGAWGGSWEPADTNANGTFKGDNIFRFMIPLNDDGINGDEVAGDNIWSAIVNFPVGTAGGNVEYKYGAWYDGATVISPGTPMDNEGLFGTNHNFLIAPSDNVVNAYNVWGDFDTPTGVKEIDGITPDKYSLEQNYPNPFNPSTVIEYSIPKAADVTLAVYNLLGQKVATLVNTQQAQGAYEVKFDASRLSSGIYFYTLTAGDFVKTKKMMLLK